MSSNIMTPPPSQKPGTWSILIQITITIWLITTVIALLFTALYNRFYNDERARNTIDFLARSIGIAAGVTSAFYVGENIKRNIDEKELDRKAEEARLVQQAQNNKINRALNYIAEWNNPSRNLDKKNVVKKCQKLVEEAENNKPTD